jgi:hypothetical protein
VADARDIIHQIEYRWHDRRDLSPVASTMSQESLRGWDSLIRAWVRHPHADGLPESVCYQVLPNGRAALAWRYEDWQAAEREDGTWGRPLVSRVLAGQASVLTPEIAIVLCRTGPPATIGPRPGQVATGTGLSVIPADELDVLVRDRTAGLDQEAARQEGLWQVVVTALSHPHTPLAIHIRDRYILKPPEQGVQCLLLWGLRRTLWPLLATTGRGWSFSTFEPPLEDVDPTTLPDILFRRAQDAPPAAPARPRDEIKVRPFDPKRRDAGTPEAELAGWLVAEYQERGGDELRQLITRWCGSDQSLKARLYKVYDELSARQSPVVVSGQPAPYVPVSPASDPAHEPDVQPLPAKPDEPVPYLADQAAPAGPEASAPADDRLPEDEAFAIPQMPAPAEDHAGPVPQPPAPDEAPGGSATVPERLVPDQETEVPQPTADEVTTYDISWAGTTDTDPYAGLSRPADIAADEIESPGSHAPEYPAEQDYFAQPADQGYFADQQYRSGFPYPTARPPEPDMSSQPPAPDPIISGYSSRSWSDQRDSSLENLSRDWTPPVLPPRSEHPHSSRGRKQQSRISRPAAVSDLLKRLPAVGDAQEFDYILGDILNRESQPHPNDRVKARREVSKDEWYDSICAQFGRDVLDVDTLAGIFQIIVIPDLDNLDVVNKIAEWTERAQPAVIGGLLEAAKYSGDDAWQLMMQILQPKLAYRWAIDNYLETLWDPSLAQQQASDSGRRFGFKKKN